MSKQIGREDKNLYHHYRNSCTIIHVNTVKSMNLSQGTSNLVPDSTETNIKNRRMNMQNCKMKRKEGRKSTRTKRSESGR